MLSARTIVLCGVAVLALILIVLRLREALRRRAFVNNRQPMSDDEFMKALQIPPDKHDMCTSIRNSVAKIIESPRELIHPDEPISTFVGLGFTLGDLILVMGEDLSLEIDVDKLRETVLKHEAKSATCKDLLMMFIEHQCFVRTE